MPQPVGVHDRGLPGFAADGYELAALRRIKDFLAMSASLGVAVVVEGSTSSTRRTQAVASEDFRYQQGDLARRGPDRPRRPAKALG
jgi:hypothetical protein